MSGRLPRVTALAATALVLVVALAWGYWAGIRSQSAGGPAPSTVPALTAEQEALARRAALEHPTVQAVLATIPQQEWTLRLDPLNDRTGKLVGVSVWIHFAAPRTVRGTWTLPRDWLARWPPQRIETATYTVENAEGLHVWVDLASGAVVRVDAPGAYARIDPAEDPFALPPELQQRAYELALTAPWLEPVLAQATPKLEGASPWHDAKGDLIGAVVGLTFSEPVLLDGQFPVVMKPEYEPPDRFWIEQHPFTLRVSMVGILVDFRTGEPLGLVSFDAAE